MAEVMYGLVSEARRNRFSAIPKLTEEDIVNVWDNVSKFIEKQMALQKGVCVPGLGIFTYSQKKLDVGNNKYIQIQRPVFILSEKFAMTHALNYTKHHTTGQIPVVQLNFAALSNETPFNRDTVESCVKEVLQALSRSVQAKRNVEFHFAGIGRLSIRESKVKMKFYKEFLRSMDGSGSLVHALSNRPGTADSVLSEPISPRPHTSNTLVLPRITPGEGGNPNKSLGKEGMPTITEQDEDFNEAELARGEVTTPDNIRTQQEQVEAGLIPVVEPLLGEQDLPMEEDALPKSPSRLVSPAVGSRTTLQPAKAIGVSYSIPEPSLTPPPPPPRSPFKASPPRGIRGSTVCKNGRSPTQDGTRREQSLGEHQSRDCLQSPVSPSRLRCSHSDKAGQELCYLCHQRSQKNVPIYFSEERRQRELEQDRLLQQYQQQKDTEAIFTEQSKNFDNRRYNQKVAAFNLGVSEAVKEKLSTRPTEFCRSYLFQNRPLTPPRYIKQDEYSKDLGGQVLSKYDKLSKLKKEQEFLERLEQVQLAEDLGLQREQYLRDKKMGSDAYRKALDVQVRFKPLPIPALEPDSKAPIFGVLDATDEKLIERKSRAHQLYQEQLEMVSQRKRDSILKDLRNQKEESDMLERTRRDIILDRALRHQERLDARRSLEDNWAANACRKKDVELEERRNAQSPGMLIHEQCDKYHRCKQCGRRPQNCGESNVWSESRYIPGSRLIV
ncbi:Coiled-coil domain-containing protein 81 [Desmophyllum pertusum]|uniref:Coiled-coil domain-containing protein 81 n=1 Tax=Desmophyllum pertusum TaxID=174260 RepID=A0A9X0CLV0_9CNID|nr:Coiled-coil domain-containing protein 81 [Desmophyllum pertusum]